MTAIMPAPTYFLVHAAWIPTLAIWHAEGRFAGLEGAACGDYPAGLAASWRIRLAWLPHWIDEHGRPRPTRPYPPCQRVIPVNRRPAKTYRP